VDQGVVVVEVAEVDARAEHGAGFLVCFPGQRRPARRCVSGG
jgi:hypothetical protein